MSSVNSHFLISTSIPLHHRFPFIIYILILAPGYGNDTRRQWGWSWVELRIPIVVVDIDSARVIIIVVIVDIIVVLMFGIFITKSSVSKMFKKTPVMAKAFCCTDNERTWFLKSPRITFTLIWAKAMLHSLTKSIIIVCLFRLYLGHSRRTCCLVSSIPARLHWGWSQWGDSMSRYLCSVTFVLAALKRSRDRMRHIFGGSWYKYNSFLIVEITLGLSSARALQQPDSNHNWRDWFNSCAFKLRWLRMRWSIGSETRFGIGSGTGTGSCAGGSISSSSAWPW